MYTTRQGLPTLLFGAFDRHNFGDLIFPHVADSLLGSENLIFAGLVKSDLSGVGGFSTQSLSHLAKEFGGRPINILHVGGELLTCEAWQAAVMVQASEKVQPLLRRLEAHRDERVAWTRNVLGISALAPYTVSRELFPGAVHIIFNAVGGVELNERDEPFRTEVLTKLKCAQYLSVRDSATLDILNGHGIQARLVPDPAVMVAELFGEHIERTAGEGEVAAIINAFPQGYIACQFSADFGDDATLEQVAGQLEQLATSSGYGVVLFRAGAAPWHDDLECYRRLAGFMRSAPLKIFGSLDIWEICALIAHSRAFCGSSLHGRIVAMAFGIPRVNVRHPRYGSHTGKQAAYAATWELPSIPATIDISGIAAGVRQVLAVDGERLLQHANLLARHYREEFEQVVTLLQ